MNIMAGSLGGFIPPIRTNGLSILSVVVNARCNLHCRHCYLRPDGPPVGLRADQWLRFLRSALTDLKPEVICFSGKEVFAAEESAQLLFDTVRLRDDLQASPECRT